jgi:hypothetical protein
VTFLKKSSPVSVLTCVETVNYKFKKIRSKISETKIGGGGQLVIWSFYDHMHICEDAYENQFKLFYVLPINKS